MAEISTCALSNGRESLRLGAQARLDQIRVHVYARAAYRGKTGHAWVNRGLPRLTEYVRATDLSRFSGCQAITVLTNFLILSVKNMIVVLE